MHSNFNLPIGSNILSNPHTNEEKELTPQIQPEHAVVSPTANQQQKAPVPLTKSPFMIPAGGGRGGFGGPANTGGHSRTAFSRAQIKKRKRAHLQKRKQAQLKKSKRAHEDDRIE